MHSIPRFSSGNVPDVEVTCVTYLPHQVYMTDMPAHFQAQQRRMHLEGEWFQAPAPRTPIIVSIFNVNILESRSAKIMCNDLCICIWSLHYIVGFQWSDAKHMTSPKLP